MGCFPMDVLGETSFGFEHVDEIFHTHGKSIWSRPYQKGERVHSMTPLRRFEIRSGERTWTWSWWPGSDNISDGDDWMR